MQTSKLYKDIKTLRIQGAQNIAKAAVKCLKLKGISKKKLLSLRPTEPMLKNALDYAEDYGIETTLNHFNEALEKINKFGTRKIKNNSTIFTHCHSSTVISVLKEAKKQGKNFKVFNTETRPLYQGRKTAKELSKLGIDVTQVVDSAAGVALKKSQTMKKVNLVLLGCDAILSDGSVINKIGSGMFAEIAYHHKIPVYIVTDSWKFSPRRVDIEQRNFKEIWKNAPRKIKIKNPAFEIINPKHITGIISELGILKPKEFIKKVKKEYKSIKELICLDMDHTLLDANKSHILSYNKAFKKNNLPETDPEKLKSMFGMLGTKIIKKLYPKLSKKKIEKIRKDRHKILIKETKKYIKPFKGVVSTLKRLRKKYKLAIVSNCTHRQIEILLSTAGISINLFDVIVGYDDVKEPKPAPDEIFRAEKLLHIRADYMVGDSIYDIIAGKKAGIRTVAVLSGNTPKKNLKKKNPDFIIKTLKDLPKVLKC